MNQRLVTFKLRSKYNAMKRFYLAYIICLFHIFEKFLTKIKLKKNNNIYLKMYFQVYEKYI